MEIEVTVFNLDEVLMRDDLDVLDIKYLSDEFPEARDWEKFFGEFVERGFDMKAFKRACVG